MRARAKISRVVVATAMSAIGLTAMATTAHAGVLGECPSGDLCLYALSGSNILGTHPSSEIPQNSGLADTPNTRAGGVINNTDPLYTSEGPSSWRSPVCSACTCPTPTTSRRPAPSRTPQGGETIDAVQFGDTAADADATTIALLSDCPS